MIQPPCTSAARVPPGTGTGGSGGRGPCLQLFSDKASVRSACCRACPLLSLGGQTVPDSKRDDVMGSAVISHPACPPQPEPHPRWAVPCLWDVTLKATPRVCSDCRSAPPIRLSWLTSTPTPSAFVLHSHPDGTSPAGASAHISSISSPKPRAWFPAGAL